MTSSPTSHEQQGLALPDAALIGDCVHCGFCLPTCPTYVLWGEEMDSPRGRIHLMEHVTSEGGMAADATATHIDRCLGCMACVTACPSGVQYDRLIETMRVTVEQQHERPRSERLLRAAIFALFPYPRRLRMLRGPLKAYQRTGLGQLLRRSGLLERMPAILRTAESLAPPLQATKRLPRHVSARGERRAVVGLLTGCVQDAFFGHVNAASARVLAMEGCDVVIPRDQTCCGALSMHNGRDVEAGSFARRTIETFDRAGVDAVVVNAAGCGSAMKDYRHLLADDDRWSDRAARFADRTRDLTEVLVELGPVAQRHPLRLDVAYHDACHLAHAQGIRAQPRALLAGIPELTVREVAEADVCCGSAGVYNLLQPEAAAALGDRKATNVLATGADLLVTGNPGCMLQLAAAADRQGRRLPVAATATVLDASLHGLPASAVLPRATSGVAR